MIEVVQPLSQLAPRSRIVSYFFDAPQEAGGAGDVGKLPQRLGEIMRGDRRGRHDLRRERAVVGDRRDPVRVPAVIEDPDALIVDPLAQRHTERADIEPLLRLRQPLPHDGGQLLGHPEVVRLLVRRGR